MKAMIFAAGFGTRLRPITDTLPKALVPVHNKPLLEHVVEKLKRGGVNEIIVNVHHLPDKIIHFINEKNSFGIHIEISDERDNILDTGGGIKKAACFFSDNKPFIVHNVDILSNVDLMEIYRQHLEEPNRLASLVVNSRETNRYLLFDDDLQLHGWVNTQTNQTKPFESMDTSLFQKFAYAGIQVVSPTIFKLMEKEPEKFPIIDFYLKNCSDEKIAGFIPENLKMLDVGKIDSLEKAEEFLTV